MILMRGAGIAGEMADHHSGPALVQQLFDPADQFGRRGDIAIAEIAKDDFGADAPGGTFQAGSILAAMWLLVMLAGLRPAPETRSLMLRLLLVGGPALFFAIGFLGFAVAGAFLAYPEPLAKALIVGIEAALTVAIALALGLLVAGPSNKAPAP